MIEFNPKETVIVDNNIRFASLSKQIVGTSKVSDLKPIISYIESDWKLKSGKNLDTIKRIINRSVICN